MTRSHTVFAFILVFLLVGAASSFTGCSMTSSFESNRHLAGTAGPAPSTSTTTAVQSIKPALAVRAMECLMCHAQINSNVITDFGQGDSFFFATNSQSNSSSYSYANAPWYGNYFGTWQLGTINGTVTIPKVTLSDPGFLSSIGQTNSLSLFDFMKLDLGTGYYGGGNTVAGQGPMISAITPAAGNPALVEASSVMIGAPSAATLAAELPGGVMIGAIGGGTISGLSLVTGNGGGFVTNVGSSVTCMGDVVVNGTLLLSSASIATDAAGCRIYATRTIFVVGNVTTTTTSNSENVQLSSALGIMLGFDVESLSTRLGSWYDDSQPLFREMANSAWVAAVEQDAAVIGDANLPETAVVNPVGSTVDGSACAGDPSLTTAQAQEVVAASSECGTLGGTWTQFQATNGGPAEGNYCSCAFHYSRLLLNAPNVQGNYLGQFSGVVISELALFEPGATSFQYDTTFDSPSIQILPLLGSSVLDVEP